MNDLISRQQTINAMFNLCDRLSEPCFRCENPHIDVIVDELEQLPPAQQNMSEEYAKAVRNWLVNYQIKCAELKGRYTPYEVLGWIVSDWRKENGIW